MAERAHISAEVLIVAFKFQMYQKKPSAGNPNYQLYKRCEHNCKGQIISINLIFNGQALSCVSPRGGEREKQFLHPGNGGEREKKRVKNGRTSKNSSHAAPIGTGVISVSLFGIGIIDKIIIGTKK